MAGTAKDYIADTECSTPHGAYKVATVPDTFRMHALVTTRARQLCVWLEDIQPLATQGLRCYAPSCDQYFILLTS